MGIGKRIELLVKTLNLTGIKFAESIGVNSSNITHIVGDRSKPSYSFLLSILETYPNVSPDWLMIGTGDMFRRNNDDFINSEINNNPEHITVESLFNDSITLNSTNIAYDSINGEYFPAEMPENDVIKTESSFIEEPVIESLKQAVFNEIQSPIQAVLDTELNKTKVRSISKIMVMYTDNTFEELIK